MVVSIELDIIIVSKILADEVVPATPLLKNSIDVARPLPSPKNFVDVAGP